MPSQGGGMEETMKQSILRDENGKFYYGWWIVVFAAVMCMFGYSCIVSVTGVFLLPVTTEMGFTIGGFSAYISIMSVTNIIVLALISKHFNEKNIKKIMTLAAIVGAISFVGFSYSQQLWQFYAFAVPMGFCFGCMSMTPSMLLISNWFGEKLRGKAMSIFLAIMSVGTSAIIAIFNMVIISSGWRLVYLIIAICLAVCIPVILKMVCWSPATRGIKRIGEIDSVSPTTFDLSKVPGIMFKDAIKKPLTWLAFISISLIVLASSAILQHGIATSVIAGFSPTFAANAISIISIAMIFTGILIGAMSDRFRLSVTAVGTALVFVVCILGLAFMSNGSIFFYIFLAGYMLGVPAVNLIPPLLMVHMFGEKEIGRYISFTNIFISVGGVFGATLVGLMFDATGSYRMPWLVMAAVIAIAAVIRAVCASRKAKFIPKSENRPNKAE
jgi:MFS family permease